MKVYQYPSKSAEAKVASIINRGQDIKKKDVQTVTKILAAVRKHGDAAVVAYSRQFDAPEMDLDALEVSTAEMQAAQKQVDNAFMGSLRRAISQIRVFHERQKEKSWFSVQRPGTFLGQMVIPVDVAGVYVPGGKGGKTPLVSTVLMCAIPAKIAGVGKVVMVTPPTKDGTVNPHLLVAAKEVGVDAIYKIGSAWAVAALAYGTDTIPKADIIVGPGNIYVSLAKKMLAGTVGIDMIAGPSEVLVIADDSANPEFVAADLLSQAEHDPLSAAVLLTDSGALARKTANALDRQLQTLSRCEIARQSLAKYGALVKVPALDDAFALSNRVAPEHLELHIRDPFEHIGKVRNAGAVFMGDYTPEPVGDYIAGSNHVLPTAGTARFSSALSVDRFLKKTSLIHYSKAAFEKEAQDVIRLARIEGLDAHANAIKIRLA